MVLHLNLINILLSSLILIFISCKSDVRDTTSKSSTNVSENVRTYTDTFAYCKAVVNIDSPDSRYVGSKVPEVIARGLQKAFDVPPGAPLDVFTRGTYWRWMDGKVYACNVGANLPCDQKADTSYKPNQGMVKWCESNLDSEFIPAYASGRATIYEWRCKGKEPMIVREITKPDAAGYISNIWHEITPD
ncbi:MAG TPA: hypothetical protein VI935_06705 [Thermodesulfobacteriota bacterium]|nr:hypothetical protein [Thermodesulfobacteriota bacterium]